MSLIHRAKIDCGAVAASIFVNPLQFNNKEDLANYPRQLAHDLEQLREAGCHMLFHPSEEQLFQHFAPVNYDLGGLDTHWEGPSRPGHFQGVVNVVERLFHYIRPDVAFFGEKDRQQLAIIRHARHLLRWPERIVGCATLREPDGLAMSSRNQRLGPDERRIAPLLYQALQAVHTHFRGIAAPALEAGRSVLRAEPRIQLDYLGIADAETLEPLHGDAAGRDMVALIAAQVGPVRLIDNITLAR